MKTLKRMIQIWSLLGAISCSVFAVENPPRNTGSKIAHKVLTVLQGTIAKITDVKAFVLEWLEDEMEGRHERGMNRARAFEQMGHLSLADLGFLQRNTRPVQVPGGSAPVE